jgi:fibronectin-binding autotransporter adhesin
MASRYWVGGTGTWDNTNTANWSETSGGEGGASAPTSDDDVYFDGSSDVGSAFTVTIGTNATCRSFIIGDGDIVTELDQTMTLTGTSGLTVHGSLFFPSTRLTRTFSGTINFVGNNVGNTITINGINPTSNSVTFNLGMAGTGDWSFNSSFFCGGNFIVYSGTLNTNNYNLSAPRIQTQSGGQKILNFGSSTVTATASTQTFIINDASNVTLNSGTSTIVLTNDDLLFSGGNKTYYALNSTNAGAGGGTTIRDATFNGVVTISRASPSVSVNNCVFNDNVTYSAANITLNGVSTYNAITTFSSTAAGIRTIVGENTFNNLIFVNRNDAGAGIVNLSANQTISGMFDVQSTNEIETRRICFKSNAPGTQRTITAATASLGVGIDFGDIIAEGTSTPWDLSTKYGGDCGNNQNIFFPPTKRVYRRGVGNWSDTQWALTPTGSVTAGTFPLPQDTIIFHDNTTSGTHTINSNYNIGNLDLSNSAVITLTNGTAVPNVYGNIDIGSNVTISGTGTITLIQQSGSISTIRTNGRSFTQILRKDGDGTLQLLDNFISNSVFELTRGTLDVNNNILTVSSFSSNNTNIRGILFGDEGKIQITNTTSTGATWNIVNGEQFFCLGSRLVEYVGNGFNSLGYRQIRHTGVTEQNVVNVKMTTGGGVLNIFPSSLLGDIELASNVSGSSIGAQSGTICYGNIILEPISNGITASGTNGNLAFGKSNGIQQIYTNGTSVDVPITKTGFGTLQLQDNLTQPATRTFTLTQGTINLNGKKLTTGTFSTSNSNARTIDFSTNGALEITNSGSAFNATTGTNLTTAGVGRIIMSSDSAKTFIGGGRTYPELIQAGSGSLTITGNNTFRKISNMANPTTLIFAGGSTQSIKYFNISGSQDTPVTLNSTTTTNFTLNNTGTLKQIGYGLIVSRSNATPSNNWYGDIYSVGVNTSGWTFLEEGRAGMRLSPGNTFYTDRASNIELDEVSVDTIRISPDVLFAGEFDEVTPIDVKMRFGSNGTIYVSSSFDETDILF